MFIPIMLLVLSISVGYKIIIFYSTSRSKIIYLVFDILLIYLVFLAEYILFYNLFPTHQFSETVIYYSIYAGVVPIILSVIYLWYVKRVSIKVMGISVYNYLKGFIDSWVLNDPTLLESLISKNSVAVKSEIDYIVLPDLPRNPLLMIIPYFHFGPFKNIGSSDFPANVSKYFFNKGLQTVTMHAPSTHSLDIPNKLEVKKIIEAMDDFSKPDIIDSISNIYSIKSGSSTVHMVRLGNTAILFLEAEEMEDVPPKVIKEIRLEGQKLGYKHVIIIDSHNSLTRIRYRLSDETISKMTELAKRALREGINIDTYPFKASSVKINIPGLTIRDGLGSSGVSIILWETLTSRNILINFDSNNLSPQLRNAVIGMVKKEFNSNVIVTSDDTHEVSAIPLNIRGYNILGENKDDIKQILMYIRKGIIKCLEKLGESDILLYHKELNIRVIGMDALDKLNKLLSLSYLAAKNLLFKFILPIILLTVILTYIVTLVLF